MTSKLVVCHDAGGAEIVSSWVMANMQPEECEFILDGPAVEIFKRKLASIQILEINELDLAVRRAAGILTGSGWGSDLECRAIVAARAHTVHVATYLDHWVNYKERFLCSGQECLPDEIWVGDQYAHRIAAAMFPAVDVKLVPNHYFIEITKEITNARGKYCQGNPPRILFVSEPKAEASRLRCGHDRHWGYTEFEALEGYLEWLQRQRIIVGEIRVRLHPAEPGGKYQDILTRYRNYFSVTESSGTSLIEDCTWADWVVGCESMAMVVGLLAGRRVFSCIPKNGLPLSLPQEGITRLFT